MELHQLDKDEFEWIKEIFNGWKYDRCVCVCVCVCVCLNVLRLAGRVLLNMSSSCSCCLVQAYDGSGHSADHVLAIWIGYPLRFR